MIHLSVMYDFQPQHGISHNCLEIAVNICCSYSHLMFNYDCLNRTQREFHL